MINEFKVGTLIIDILGALIGWEEKWGDLWEEKLGEKINGGLILGERIIFSQDQIQLPFISFSFFFLFFFI